MDGRKKEMQNLNEEERRRIKKRKKELQEGYPHLREAGMAILLEKAIMIEQVLLPRTETKLLDGEMDYKDLRNFDKLNRTYALLLSRMGITFVSRNRKKSKHPPKTPLQMVKEGEEDGEDDE